MHTFRIVIYLMVGTLLLAMMVRDWLVLGLIAPVTVSGSSMAPTLRGAFVTARCPDCAHQVDVGAEYAIAGAAVPCPRCCEAEISLADLPFRGGDPVWIDRTALVGRQPHRWETVVLRAPHDANELCVKRIVGLPGEWVAIGDGDLWINGQIAVKSIAEQRALRLPIWSNERPLADDLPYNAGLSRSLHWVRDFSLSAMLRMPGPGRVDLKIDDGRLTHQVTISNPGGLLTLRENGGRRRRFRLSASCQRRLAEGPVLLEFSNFDRQLLLALGGRIELREPIADDSPPAGVAVPISVEVAGGATALGEVRMYRDTYYVPRAAGTARRHRPAVRLKKDEYFVLGDNSSISLDSRVWGPVPAKLLIGKPLASR